MAKINITQTEGQDYELLPINRSYTVEVQNYEIVDSMYKDKDGNYRKDIRWTLRILKPEEFYDRVLVMWSPLRASRNKRTGEPNKTLQFLEYLRPPLKIPEQGEIDLDDTVGRTINITLKNKVAKDGRIYQKVDSFFPGIPPEK